MPLINLGQIELRETIQLTTNLNTTKSGLTDVLIDIYNPANTKVVDNGVMTELGTSGIYQYSYMPVTKGTHTIVITCVSQRNYDELQTFQAVPVLSGGGVIYTPEKNVVDTDEMEFRKKVLAEFKKLTEKILDVESKQQVIDVDGLIETIYTNINSMLNGIKTDYESSLASLLDRINNIDNNSTLQKKNILDEFNKLDNLNNSLLELINDVPKSVNISISKMGNNSLAQFNELSKQVKLLKQDIKTQQDQVSKFSNAEIDKMDNLSKDFETRLSKLQAGINVTFKEIPKFITDKFNGIKDNICQEINTLELNTNLNKDLMLNLKELETKLFDKSNEEAIKLKDDLHKLNFELLTLSKSDRMSDELNFIKDRSNTLNERINTLDSFNKKKFQKVIEIIPKLSSKADLGVLQEEIKNNISELQSNNTKKIKVVRDKIDNVEENIKQDIQNNNTLIDKRLTGINNTLAINAEESEVNSQLNMLGLHTKENNYE